MPLVCTLSIQASLSLLISKVIFQQPSIRLRWSRLMERQLLARLFPVGGAVLAGTVIVPPIVQPLGNLVEVIGNLVYDDVFDVGSQVRECRQQVGDAAHHILDAAENNLILLVILHVDVIEVVDAANHLIVVDQIPPSEYTILKVLSAQMGVGGDDAWGSMPQEDCMLPGDVPYTLEFYMEMI